MGHDRGGVGRIDTGRAHSARVYDYGLGGSMYGAVARKP
ncbi:MULTISPECIES: SAM-dependent methyltransferase [Streptomyces]|uniref:Uncharacterized protein n=2 Tax=Streptomyces TaxID=1883 RepID=A0A646KJA0_STRJU|nr:MULTISPECIES: SAM-dependent methyltransferase [Streptomyces]MQS34392.1 hypothetical protein [Streptomyces katsurahamanus]MQT02293.1 hypothetical protein [Streptomyces jumonjinensis]